MPSAPSVAASVKAVVDTNLLVSGLLWQGTPAVLLEAVLRGPLTLCLSEALLAELTDVLSRPKLCRPIQHCGLDPAQTLRLLRHKAELVKADEDIFVPELRDPKDAIVLACAVAAQADMIVTGDQDLIVLGSFRRIPILTVAHAIEKLKLR